MRSITTLLFAVWSFLLTHAAFAQPTVSPAGPITLNPGTSVQLTASGSYTSFQWTRNYVDVVGTGPTLPVSTPGYYRVTGTNGGSSTTSAAVYVKVLSASGSADKSYTQNDVVLQQGVTTEATLDLATTKKDRTITYMDGLMRPMQKIAVKASPSGSDVIQPIEYTATGQQTRQYLSYTSGTDGLFKANAVASQQAFYSNSGAPKIARETNGLTYIESVFEDTPSGAVIEQGAAGASWQIAKDASGQSTFQGHTKRTINRTNTANEVPVFTYVYASPGLIGAPTTAAVGTAVYSLSPAATLAVTQATDEDGRVYTEYTNSLGQSICKRTSLGNGQYSIVANAYDNFGRVVMTLTPEGVKRVVSGGETPDASFLAKWAYLYQFDARGRAVAKKVPGRKWMYTVYDRWDRAVASQDGNQSDAGVWSFVKYDELGRTIITGRINSTRTWQQLTDDVESAIAAGSVGRFESKADNNLSNLRIGYTLTQTWPTGLTSNNIYTVNYFDDYDYLNASQSRLSYQVEAASDVASPASSSVLTTGLSTISQIRTLGSSSWLTSVSYYDDKARVIQSKSENVLGGVERLTTEYDFAGKTLKTYNASNVTASGPAHTIRYRYTYYDNNNPNELFAWFDKSSGTSEQLLSKKEYNELGQLADDKLGLVDPVSRRYLQSVDYRYNIRGWLSHLNNRDLQNYVSTNDDTDAEDDLFGLELKYDTDLQTGSTTPRYNGNIAESMWRSHRDNKLRGFAYQYDNANRLTDARYAAYDYIGGSWGWNGEKDDTGLNGSVGGKGRFTTSDIQYDLNGNITQMNRVGHRSTVQNQARFAPIDQFQYSYNGNQLQNVVDAAGGSAAPNDFEDMVQDWRTYEYDSNGNMTYEPYKGLQVTYNELDLPSSVVNIVPYTPFYAIDFTYSATGEKLYQNYSTDYSDSDVYYIGAFTYGAGQLLSVSTPTGRALFAKTPSNSTRHWVQEYHIRDQQGNLRIAFRDEGQDPLSRLAATMEPANASAEEQHFENLAATRQFDPAHARTGDYAARLNAGQSQRMYGPSTAVQVSAGDSIRFEVYGRYDVPKKGGAWPMVLPFAATATTPGADATIDGRPAVKRGFLPKLAAGITLAWTAIPHLFQHKEEVPRASVKYDFYDKDSTLVATEVRYLEHDAANNWQQLVVGFKAKQDGYVLISLQNATAKDVWFDDALLRTTQDMIVQENHYDPWGQHLVDIEVQGSPDCKQEYAGQERIDDGGLEWVDCNARMYDAQLGRWHAPDPLDEQTSSYAYSGNNPVKYNDPSGEYFGIDDIAAMIVGGIINVAINSGKINNPWDALGYFAIGAAAGEATLLTGGLAAGVWGTTGFFAGAAVGAIGGLTGGIITGAGNKALQGGSLGEIASAGLSEGLIGGVTGGLFGGIAGGIQASKQGKYFWNGKEQVLLDEVNLANFPVTKQSSTYDCVPACMESFDRARGGTGTMAQFNTLAGDPAANGGVRNMEAAMQSGGFQARYVGKNPKPSEVISSMKNGTRFIASESTGTVNASNEALSHAVIPVRVQVWQRVGGRQFTRQWVMDPAQGAIRSRMSSFWSSNFWIVK